MEPDIRSSFEYEGQHINVEWYTVTRKAEIPDYPWKQIYAIGNLDGLVPLVTSSTSSYPFGLPGGSTEDGETLDDTLRREMIEECNMRVISWKPLGYQVLTDPAGNVVHQFRAYAKLEKLGEFINDPGGHVIKNTLVSLDDVNNKVQYGDVGERIIELARPHFQ